MLDEFLQRHRVFTFAQISEVLQREGPRNQAAVDTCVRRLFLQGRIGRIRRELYFAVPRGEAADSCFVDLCLAASLLAPDAILSHVTALEYHTGAAIPSGDRVCFMTTAKIRPTIYAGIRFCPCRPPASLSRTGWQDIQVKTVDWQAELVRVTGPERSLVDTLNAIKHGGGLKIVWPLLEKMATTEGFTIKRCVEYLKWLEKPAATTRTGWFLQRYETHLNARPRDFSIFYEHRPAQPRYLIPGDRGGTLVTQWNLIVPREIAG
jgi:predicted transcriptional regulator of viral defense system